MMLVFYMVRKCFSGKHCGMWASAFEMSFPFRYEMGSPGVFEEIVNSSDEGGYFDQRNKYLPDNNIVT